MRLLRITEAHDYDVVGTLLAPTEAAPRVGAVAADSDSRRYEVPLPDLQEGGETGRVRFSLLQRTVPHDRSGHWASEKYASPRPPRRRRKRGRRMKIELANLISTWFGCGRSPFAPGRRIRRRGGHCHPAASIRRLRALAFSAAGGAALSPAIWAAGVTAAAAKIKDPGFVVVDEVFGRWMTLAGAATLNWKTVLAAFRCSGCSTSGNHRRCGNWRPCRAASVSTPTT